MAREETVGDRNENTKKNQGTVDLTSLKPIFGVAVSLALATGAFWAVQKDIFPTIVGKTKCGVRIRDNQVMNEKGQCLKPGLYWVRPYLDSMYEVQANTIILDVETSGNRNTKDQNSLSVALRFHYKNNLNSGNIAYHISDMASDDGKSLLKGLIEQSVNAAAGYNMAVDTLNDPKAFLFTLADNLQWRLNQNNVAIEVDAIEVNSLSVGSLRTPIQLRLKLSEDGKTWNIQNITGPASVQTVGKGLQGGEMAPK